MTTIGNVLFGRIVAFHADHLNFVGNVTMVYDENLAADQTYIGIEADNIKLFEEQINNCRKETLRKVQDIEQLLNNRISKPEVHDLVEALDVKLMTGLENAEAKLMEHLENAHTRSRPANGTA